VSDIPRSIAAQYALWWRARARERWVLVAVGVTSQELTDRTSTLPSGDTITLPLGRDPNVRMHRPAAQQRPHSLFF
jgi:hypothetical protein